MKKKWVESERTCVECGRTFVGSGKQMICSVECKKERHRRKSAESRKRRKERVENVDTLAEKMKACKKKGISYMDMQKAETLKMFGKVEE